MISFKYTKSVKLKGLDSVNWGKPGIQTPEVMWKYTFKLTQLKDIWDALLIDCFLVSLRKNKFL